ncbi:MAG: hypothetical protein ACXITV_08195 [Luteibaculaceae bacterium]
MARLFYPLLALLVLFSVDLEAQHMRKKANNSDKKFFFGVNAGMHLANNESALLYTGLFPSPGGFATQPRILEILQNQFVRAEIENHLNVTTFQYVNDVRTPRYRPAVLLGGNLTFMTSENFGIQLDINFSQVRVVDAFNIRLDGTASPIADNLFRCEVIGREQRLFIGLGFRNDFKDRNADFWPYIELGGLFGYASATENFFMVGDLRYDLITWQPPAQFVQNPLVDQSFFQTTTLGAYGGVGLGGQINEKLQAFLGYRLNWLDMNILENPNNRARAQHDIFIRFFL